MRPRRACRTVALCLLVLGLAACAAKPVAPPPPSERIILLPGADGKVGELVVTANAGGEVRLNQAYGSALVDAGSARFEQASSTEVAERYRCCARSRAGRCAIVRAQFRFR